MEVFVRWFEIQEILQQVEYPETLKAYACMILDYIASKSGITTQELIDELVPFIASVNNELGPMKIEE